MTDHSSRDTADHADENRNTRIRRTPGGQGTSQDIEETIEDLAAENRALREQVTDLAAALAEVREDLLAVKRQNGTGTDGIQTTGVPEVDAETPVLVTSGGQPTKVIGRLSDTDGIGVLGEATGSGGASRGVLGQTASADPGATGVRGEATAASGATYGVHGTTNGDAPVAAAGVFADAINTDATALRARANGGLGNGVDAQASAEGYFGIYGQHTAPSGNNAYGVVAQTASPDAPALLALGSGGGAIDTNGNVTVNDSTEQKTAGPIAKGHINFDGTVENAVNVDSATYDSTNERYQITLSESYHYQDYATLVTVSGGGFAHEGSVSGDLLVYLVNDDGNTFQASFQFVTFALPNGTVVTGSAASSRESESSIE
jgi:hypothetical protein